MSIVYLVLARVPVEGIEVYREYESRVLPLLERHQGSLERRLRSGDGTIEVHLVSFPSPAHFDAYREDPERERHRLLLEAAGAAVELFELHDDRAI
jgi:hypothetical protein